MVWAADSRWLGLLAEYLIKTTAVLSLALIGSALLRRRPAALRHFVLSALLIGLVFLPLLPSLPTGWETRLLPSRPASGERLREIPRAGMPLTIVAPLISDRSGLAATTPPARPATERLDGLEPFDRGLPFKTAHGNAAAGRALVGGAERALPFIWAAGIVCLLLRLGLGLAGAARLSREGRSVDGPVWEAVLRQFLAMVALRRPVRLKSHGRVAVPMTWGLVRPVVLLPEDCGDWDEGRRSAALFHELSHIKRVDFAVILLVRVSLALYWFNPLVWIVFRRLRREQEKACDEMVLQAGIKPSAYARGLLLFKKPAAGIWSPSAALLGLSAGASLSDRLTAILGHNTTNKEIAMRTRITLAIVIIFAVALVGSARPASPAVDKPAPAAVTAAPSTASAPAQETVVAAQEKQQIEKKKEAEKAEKEKKAQEKQKITKTIFVTTPDAGKDHIRLSTTEGDLVKDLVLDRPSIVLEAAGPGDEVRLKINGNDVVLKKGDRLTLEAKDGGLRVLGEGEVRKLEVGVPVVVRVDTTTPQVFTIKEDQEGVAVKEIVIKPVVIAEAHGVPASPAAPGVPAPAAQAAPAAPKEATTYKVVRDGKPYTITMTPRAPEPPYPPAVAYSVVPEPEGALGRREIREKLQAILEQLNQIQETKPGVREDLKKVEESLQALAEDLKKTEAGFRVEIDPEKGGRYVKVTTKEGDGKGAVYSYATAYPSQREKSMVYIGIGEGADFTVHYGGRHALDDKAAVERAIADVKKALPEGYGLEREADKDAETLVLKIKVPEGQKDHKGLIKKIIAILEEDLKPAPAKKD